MFKRKLQREFSSRHHRNNYATKAQWVRDSAAMDRNAGIHNNPYPKGSDWWKAYEKEWNS